MEVTRNSAFRHWPHVVALQDEVAAEQSSAAVSWSEVFATKKVLRLGLLIMFFQP